MIWTDAQCLQILRDADDYRHINYDDADESEYLGTCSYCMGEIYANEEHYEINGTLVHYDPDGDCLYDYCCETHSIEIDDEWWLQFIDNGKQYLVKDDKNAAKQLMAIFEPHLIAAERVW